MRSLATIVRMRTPRIKVPAEEGEVNPRGSGCKS